MVLSERRTEGRETLRQTGRQGERKRQDKASTSVPGARVCEGKAVKGGAMMGKDYMLAIIIVNYDDNIWTDQNLLMDSDLPSGWRTIKGSTGTYYWHVPTGATQWQHPCLTGMSQTLETPEEAAEPSSKETDGHTEDRLLGHEDYHTIRDPDSKYFAVRSLGWLQVEEEDLSPGRSSLAVSNVIQQLSHCRDGPEQRDRLGSWGENREMMLVLKKDTLTLLDPLDHTPLHCQPIINIRVWGVGCNNGRDRDFAFVAGDKDSCVLKCHVFRCDAPAKAVAMALHEMCSKMVAEKSVRSPSRSLTMESISPADLPRQVEVLEAVRHQVQKFEVQYIGNLPVSRAMGMEVLNRAIESIMTSTDRDDWEPAVIHVTDSMLSLWRGEDEPLWECQVRFLTFLGVGHDSHTFAVIADGGTQQFECHVFWCEPDAGILSEAVQAACMVQYQKCLVAQTPPPRPRSWHMTPSKVKRANSMDGAVFPPLTSRTGSLMTTKGSINVRKGMMAFFETFRTKQATTS
ncbi:amyloid-beta A4 precursor protein-binding family B member 3 isoform X1 [Oryzias latipes]|uniref:amyloid-beta A4 precursor protein-binding family B member 3 isoform X1 n=1 Tax=Oryzias latipes TaxID=8090 RepID=UPI0005CBDAD3|nr:amyloid-beta A4 precursor protein-binding family B member 3 isoform X1 [Oryzias latipes]